MTPRVPNIRSLPDLARVMRTATAAETVVAILALVVMTSVEFLDVLGRDLIEQGIAGAQRVGVFAFVLAGFLGLPLATAQGGHLRPKFADGLFPPRARSTVVVMHVVSGKESTCSTIGPRQRPKRSLLPIPPMWWIGRFIPGQDFDPSKPGRDGWISFVETFKTQVQRLRILSTPNPDQPLNDRHIRNIRCRQGFASQKRCGFQQALDPDQGIMRLCRGRLDSLALCFSLTPYQREI